ncbi:MAG: methyltransferase domain-containing protein [Candidatus Omnitrophota bacterium]
MPKECIICKSAERRVIFREFDIDVFRCLSCGHVYSSYEIARDYDGYFGYEEIRDQKQAWWDKAHRPMYQDFCRHFLRGKSGRLLDVGCGLGYFLKYAAMYPSWGAEGIDVSQEAVKFAREKNGLSNVRCGRIEELSLPQGSYDIITMFDVIEHIPEPDRLLAQVGGLLKKGGMLFILTPNINLWLPLAYMQKLRYGMKPGIRYLDARDHVNMYSMKTISVILKRNNFFRVGFVHLKPILGLGGNTHQFLVCMRVAWLYLSVLIFFLTFKRLNLDNICAVAQKR